MKIRHREQRFAEAARDIISTTLGIPKKELRVGEVEEFHQVHAAVFRGSIELFRGTIVPKESRPERLGQSKIDKYGCLIRLGALPGIPAFNFNNNDIGKLPENIRKLGDDLLKFIRREAADPDILLSAGDGTGVRMYPDSYELDGVPMES